MNQRKQHFLAQITSSEIPEVATILKQAHNPNQKTYSPILDTPGAKDQNGAKNSDSHRRSSKPPKPSHYCLVCGEISEYRHCGVFACHGCGLFFKRAVEKKRVFKCRKEGNCPLEGSRLRLLCSCCRFEKCKAVGMKIEAEPAVKKPKISMVQRAMDQRTVEPVGRRVQDILEIPQNQGTSYGLVAEQTEEVVEVELIPGDPEPEVDDPVIQDSMLKEVQQVIDFANTCKVFKSMTNLTKREYLLKKWPQLVFIGFMEKGYAGCYGEMSGVHRKFVEMHITEQEYEMLKTVALCTDVPSNARKLHSLCRSSPRHSEVLKLIEDTVEATTRGRASLDDRVAQILNECFPD